MKKIKGVLVKISSSGNTITKHVLDYVDFKSLYPLLGCSTFTVATRNFNGKYYDVFLDDEGLLKDEYYIGAASIGGDEILAGNLFICSHDDDGNMKSLSDTDVDSILSTMADVGDDVNVLLYSF